MNLLPQKEKTENRWNYFCRFSASLAGALLASSFIGCVLLLPSYILIKVKQAELKTNLVSLKNLREADGGEDVYRILEATDEKVNFLSSKSALSLTMAIKKVIERRPAGVKIVGLSYQPQKDADNLSAKLSLNGVSNNREAIVGFVKKLQQEPSFSSINVPVSDFAKDRDIEFSLTLIQNER